MNGQVLASDRLAGHDSVEEGASEGLAGDARTVFFDGGKVLGELLLFQGKRSGGGEGDAEASRSGSEGRGDVVQ